MINLLHLSVAYPAKALVLCPAKCKINSTLIWLIFFIIGRHFMEDINFLKSSADFSVVQGKPLNSWTKFVGIMCIIWGSLLCVGIITAAIGIPVIFIGLRIIRAYEDMKRFSQSNSYYNLSNAVDNLNGGFKIAGILIIVYLSLVVLYFAALLAILIFGIISMN
jgi:hypothetical protein